jgi:hypothetical protein
VVPAPLVVPAVVPVPVAVPEVAKLDEKASRHATISEVFRGRNVDMGYSFAMWKRGTPAAWVALPVFGAAGPRS